MKWRVNRAVKRSTLPPPSRLVMFVLSDRADAKTAVIPDEHTPLQSELAEETGLGIATVKRHLEALESDGWIIRDVPSEQGRARGERTRYRLAIGGDAKPQSTYHSDTCSTAQADTGSTYQSDTSSTARSEPSSTEARISVIPEQVSERSLSTYQTDTSSYLDDRYDQYDQLLGADAPDAEPAVADKEEPETPPAAKPKRTKKPEPQRDDVDALCTRLVKLMVERGCREPSITEKWREQARLLLDKDRIDGKPIALSSALALLEWSQQDEFWSINVMSIPTFRTQYDKLRKKALAEWKRAHPWAVPRDENEIDLTPTGERNSPSPDGFGAVIPGQYGGTVTPLRPRPSTTDQRVRAGLELAAYYRERGE